MHYLPLTNQLTFISPLSLFSLSFFRFIVVLFLLFKNKNSKRNCIGGCISGGRGLGIFKTGYFLQEGRRFQVKLGFFGRLCFYHNNAWIIIYTMADFLKNAKLNKQNAIHKIPNNQLVQGLQGLA